MAMNTCCRHNVSKHRYINASDKCIILEISLKFVSSENITITSSETKYYLVRLRKSFIASLGINTNVRTNKDKKERNSITNSSMKHLSKIIK